MEKTTFKEKTSQQLEEWKKEVQHFRKQLEHTGDEARTAFEKEKNRVVEWVEEMKVKLEGLEEVAEEQVGSLRTRLEILRVQAALGKAETKVALEGQQKQLRLKIDRLKTAFSYLEEEGKGKERELFLQAKTALEKAQARFNVFHWQLAEQKEEWLQFWQDKKSEVAQLLDRMNLHLEEAKVDASGTWAVVTGAVSDRWKEIQSSLIPEKQPDLFFDHHNEHRQWNSEIGFWEEELTYFGSQLMPIVEQSPGRLALTKVEHFQNAFKVHRMELDKIKNQIQRHELQLAQLAQDHPEKMAQATSQDHDLLREKIDMQRKLFRELKGEYYEYLSKLN